jgi:hypothetical protein
MNEQNNNNGDGTLALGALKVKCGSQMNRMISIIRATKTNENFVQMQVELRLPLQTFWFAGRY